MFFPSQNFHSFSIVLLIKILNLYFSDFVLTFIESIKSYFVITLYLTDLKNLLHVDGVFTSSFSIENVIRIDVFLVFQQESQFLLSLPIAGFYLFSSFCANCALDRSLFTLIRTTSFILFPLCFSYCTSMTSLTSSCLIILRFQLIFKECLPVCQKAKALRTEVMLVMKQLASRISYSDMYLEGVLIRIQLYLVLFMNRGEDHHLNLIRLPPQQSINLVQSTEKYLTHGRKQQDDASINFHSEKNRKAQLQNEKDSQATSKSRNEELFQQLSNNHKTLKQLVEMIDNRPSGSKQPILSFNSDQKRSSRPSSKAIFKKTEPCEVKTELRAVRQQLSRVIDLIDSRIEYHDHSEHSSFTKIDQLNEVKLHLSHQNRDSDDLVKKEEMVNYLKSIDRERIMIPRSGFFSPEAVSSSSHMLNDSSQDQSVQGKYYLNLKNSFDRMNERELRNADLIQSVQVSAAHQRNKSNKSLESLNFIHQTSPFKLSVQMPPPTETSFIKTSQVRGQQSRAVPLASNRLITIRPISLDQRKMPSYPLQNFHQSLKPQITNGRGNYQQHIISGMSTPIIRYVPPVSSRPLSLPPRTITKTSITFNKNLSSFDKTPLFKSQINQQKHMTSNLSKIESSKTPIYLFNTRPIESSILTSQNSSRLPKKRKKFSFNEFFKKNPTLVPQKSGLFEEKDVPQPIKQAKSSSVDFANLPRPSIMKSPNKVENPFLTMPSTTTMIPTQLKEIVEISQQNNPNSHKRDFGDLKSSIISAQSSLFSQAKASKYSDNGHRLQKQGLYNSNRGYLSHYYRPA